MSLLRHVLVTLVLGFMVCAPSQLAACSLPLDAFVVALPAGKMQYEGFVDTPGADNSGGNTGFVTVDAGSGIEWEVYWDPTKNGAEPKNVNLLNNIPGAGLVKKTMQITRGVTRDLYPMRVLRQVLTDGFNGKPMKLNEVYARDPLAGGWGTQKYRATAPWEIPAGNVVMIDNPPGAATPFAPTLVVVSNPPGLQEMIAQPDGLAPAAGSPYLQRLFGPGMDSPGATSTNTALASATVQGTPTTSMWRVKGGAAQPEWMNDGGAWTFAGIDSTWEFNTRGTAFNPDGGRDNKRFVVGAVVVNDHVFNTPSEPFFYRVKPVVVLRMNLTMAADEYYRWKEEKIFNDPGKPWDGQPDPSEPDREFRLTASGDIKKGNQGVDGGVATLVRALDKLSPPHIHMKGGDFTGNNGKPLDGGSAQFAVVDNNPYFAYGGGVPASVLPGVGGSTYSAANVGASNLYYSLMVEGSYPKESLKKFVIPGDMTPQSLDPSLEFPVPKPNFKWFKKPVAANLTTRKYFNSSGGIMGADPSTGITSPYGAGGEPAFSAVVFNVAAADMNEPQALNHTKDSEDGSAGGVTLKKWENRPKAFIVPQDASANIQPVDSYDTKNDSRFSELPGATGQVEPIQKEADTTPIPNGGPMPGGFNVNNAVNALLPGANCNAGTCKPNELGNFARTADITDKVRPSIALLIKDTKYNRTYVVNDLEQGWQKFATGSGNATNLHLAGAIDGSGTDVSPVEIKFDSESHAIGDQAGAWAPFTAGTRAGIFVDEDTSLVFKPYAWDNSNPHLALTNMNWEIVDDPSGAGLRTQSNYPELAPNGAGQFSYTFHDPNRGGGSGNCEVMVKAFDKANNERRLRVSFFVRSEKLAITTLEETTGNRK